MKLTKNTTEPTTIDLNINIKNDLERFSKILNTSVDRLVNLGIASLLEENVNLLQTEIIKDALYLYLKGDEVHEIFSSPFINVDASWGEKEDTSVIKFNVLDDAGNIIDHGERIFAWNEKDKLNEYLVELSFYIPFESDTMKTYLDNQLGYLQAIKGGM